MYYAFQIRHQTRTRDTDLARALCGFNEQLGVLYHRKLVDINLVSDLFTVKRPWEKIRRIAKGARKEFNQPTLYEWFEYLYNEMQKRGLDQP
jgi:hypothetical protein